MDVQYPLVPQSDQFLGAQTSRPLDEVKALRRRTRRGRVVEIVQLPVAPSAAGTAPRAADTAYRNDAYGVVMEWSGSAKERSVLSLELLDELTYLPTTSWRALNGGHFRSPVPGCADTAKEHLPTMCVLFNKTLTSGILKLYQPGKPLPEGTQTAVVGWPEFATMAGPDTSMDVRRSVADYFLHACVPSCMLPLWTRLQKVGLTNDRSWKRLIGSIHAASQRILAIQGQFWMLDVSPVHGRLFASASPAHQTRLDALQGMVCSPHVLVM